MANALHEFKSHLQINKNQLVNASLHVRGAGLPDQTIIDAGVGSMTIGQIYMESANGDKKIKYSDGTSLLSVPRQDYDEIITGQWSFSPPVSQSPFLLSANAQGQLVVGLNSDYLQGYQTSLTNLSAANIPLRNASGNMYCEDPTLPLHTANKRYVDALSQGLQLKNPVRVASVSNFSATYSSGTTLTGSSNGVISIDGVTLDVNDRVLLKDQSTGTQNGIYFVSEVGDASNPPVLIRATDANAYGEVISGMYCFVTEGTENNKTSWVLTTTGDIWSGGVGTTALTFQFFDRIGEVTAGNGITLDVQQVHFFSQSYTVGDLYSANSSTTLTRIPSSKGFLRSTGALNVPGYAKVPLGDSDYVSGILPITNGGTGTDTLSAGIIKSDGSNLSSFSFGTQNYLVKWGSTDQSDSLLYDTGTRVGFGTQSPLSHFDLHLTQSGLWGIRVGNSNSSTSERSINIGYYSTGYSPSHLNTIESITSGNSETFQFTSRSSDGSYDDSSGSPVSYFTFRAFRNPADAIVQNRDIFSIQNGIYETFDIGPRGHVYIRTDSNLGTDAGDDYFMLKVGGHVGPDEHNTYDLGKSDIRWRNIYAGTIYANVSPGSVVGLTEGSVIFVDSGGALTEDNDKFFWDETNFYLGIGTNNPDTFFHIMDGDTSVSVSSDSTAVFESTGVNYVTAIRANSQSAGFVFANSSTEVDGGMIMSSNRDIVLSSYNASKLTLSNTEIKSHANFIPSADSTYTIGTDTVRWSSIYGDNYDGFVMKAEYNHAFHTLTNSPQYVKVATLPASTSSTFDFLCLKVRGGGWTSLSKFEAEFQFSNRGSNSSSLNFDNFLIKGSLNDLFVKVIAVRPSGTSGSLVDIYICILNDYVHVAYDCMEHQLSSANAIIYHKPSMSSSAPTGTTLFDSADGSTYPNTPISAGEAYFWGHVLPGDQNNVYSLGSSSYHWNKGWFRDVKITRYLTLQTDDTSFGFTTATDFGPATSEVHNIGSYSKLFNNVYFTKTHSKNGYYLEELDQVSNINASAIGGGSVSSGTHYIKIEAVGKNGSGLASTEESVVLGATGSIELTWDAVEGADSYKIYRSTSSGTYGASSLVGTSLTNSYNITTNTLSSGSPNENPMNGFVQGWDSTSFKTSSPIYIDGSLGNSNSIIEVTPSTDTSNGGNNLYIRAGSAPSDIQNRDGGDLYLQPGLTTGTASSGLKFYYVPAGVSGTSYNSRVLAWEVTGSGHFVPGTDSTFLIGSSSKYVSGIYVDTLYSNFHTYPRSTTSDGLEMIIQAQGGQSGGTNRTGGTLRLSGGISTGNADSTIDFYTAIGTVSGTSDNIPSLRWRMDGAGHYVPGVNNTYDIGSSSLRIRKIWATDLDISNPPTFGGFTAVRKFACDLDNVTYVSGSNPYVVTHSLGTRDITISVRETASPYNEVEVSKKVTTTDSVTIEFTNTPTPGDYRIIITG